MSRSTVFVTGATGFIGAHVAALALRTGYNVKLSVRRESQIDTLRQGLGDLHGNLDFVVISDYTKEHAFDTALQGVDHVIHVASPLPKPGEDLLTPAVKGTLSILRSATLVPSIKKVVITGSVASLIPLGQYGNDLVVTGKRQR
jgi:nucleoside-diphosphate-sugar epimerase